ncbi:MAG: metallophosphoesterase, partial [Candidatus Coproplasma sp.]
MIYITGDTHGDIDFNKLKIFARKNPEITINDYVIICGDFGAVWDERTLRRDLMPYTMLPFTVLFVDGNHENFDLLSTYKVEEWHGGKIHRIKPNIIHLMRGQVFEIDGKTFFTFGGATSVDKWARQERISWWKQEMPSFEELDEGIANLKRYNNKVDYIITHSCGERALMYPPLRTRSFQMGRYPENQMLSYFEDTIDYKHWYFGHYHM